MTEELGLIGDEDTSPLKSALVTFVSFVVAGFMPLVAYVFSSFVQFFSQHSFLSACILTAIVLFAVGGLRQIVTNIKWYIGGIEMLLIGGASAAVAYIVGSENIETSEKLAKHAQSIGADAISAVCPPYYSNIAPNDFIGYFREITKAAPNIPFFLYHIPVVTHFKGDLLKLLNAMAESIPTFAGVKYSDPDLTKLQECLRWSAGRYKFFYGVDNMIVYSLILGVNGLIGSTYNVAPKLYNKIIEYYQNKDLTKAIELQDFAIKMIRIFEKYGGLPAIKAAMKIVGIDFSPMRFPIKSIEEEFVEMEKELENEGLIEWIG